MNGKQPANSAKRRRWSTRDVILATASMLFAKHGYSAVTLRQITQAAGTNIASVNYYFGSKQKLFAEVCGRALATGVVDDDGHPVGY